MRCDARQSPDWTPSEDGDIHLIDSPQTLGWSSSLPPRDEEHVVEENDNEKPWRASLTRSTNFIDNEDSDIEMEMEMEEGRVDTETESTASTATTGSTKRRVSFTSVEVREYSLVVGDHPFCSDWLPLSLDWKYNKNTNVYSIEDYDERKYYDDFYFELSSGPRRLSLLERRNRLRLVSGFTDIQLARAQQDVFKTYQQEWQADAGSCGVELEQENLHDPMMTNVGDNAVSA